MMVKKGKVEYKDVVIGDVLFEVYYDGEENAYQTRVVDGMIGSLLYSGGNGICGSRGLFYDEESAIDCLEELAAFELEEVIKKHYIRLDRYEQLRQNLKQGQQ